MNSDLFDEYGVCKNGYSIRQIADLVTPDLSTSAATALLFLMSNYPTDDIAAVQDECAQLITCS